MIWCTIQLQTDFHTQLQVALHTKEKDLLPRLFQLVYKDYKDDDNDGEDDDDDGDDDEEGVGVDENRRRHPGEELAVFYSLEPS